MSWIEHNLKIKLLYGGFALCLAALGGCYHDYGRHNGYGHGHYAAPPVHMTPAQIITPAAPMAPAMQVTPAAPMTPAMRVPQQHGWRGHR